MTEDTQKYLRHLPDLKFESQQTEAKGLGIITTYFVARKRTTARAHNDEMQSFNDIQNEEEEKGSHASELFQDSDDSRKIELKEEETKNDHLQPQNSNLGRGFADQFEQSIMIEKDVSDNGKNENDKNKNKNVTFDLPKYLICIKKKNRKYESYIFKKNIENYRFFFNLSVILSIIVFAVSEANILRDGASSLNKEQTVEMICLGAMAILSLIVIYLSTQQTRKSPITTILTIYLYYSFCFIYSVFIDIDHVKNDNDKINYFFFTIFMVAYTSHLRLLMFRHMVLFYVINCMSWIIIKIIYSKHAIEETIYLLFTVASTLISHYSSERTFRNSFNRERSLNHEIKRTQALLRNLVPPNVFRGLLKGKRIADNLQNVTLLYTDMCGFTAFSKLRQPKEVVKLLSELFQRMDNLCIKNNVYKVHTIGD